VACPLSSAGIISRESGKTSTGGNRAGYNEEQVEKKSYSLSEAAKVASVSEDELRCAIKDGLLRADFLQNTGEYQVTSDELTLYLRRSRRVDLPVTSRKRKILIIDDEINFANIMKLELERDPRIEAKFATWGKDGVTMAESYVPDLCLIDFMLPDITGDQVLAALREIKQVRKARMVVYSAHTRDAIRQNPNLEARLNELGADEFLSKSAGMRALIVKVYEILGLDTQTRVLRKQI
jgi:CheY-like chemotaxis protein